MVFDQTQQQSSEEQTRARALSLKRLRPPTDVPGYEPKRFLGAGAYGEVWVAVDTNTGRQVAIKFYAHRGGWIGRCFHARSKSWSFFRPIATSFNCSTSAGTPSPPIT